jgi:biopolymer transport protein ExbD
MSVRFTCPQCGKQIAAPEAIVGQQRACPNCGIMLIVPTMETAATSRAIDEGAAPADHPLLLFPPREDGHGNLIDMTAMVDIVFFLLIFFLVTSMQSLEAVINLPTPESTEGASSTLQTVPDVTNDPSLVTVTIEADDSVWVEEEEALSEGDLRSKLRSARQEDECDGVFIKGAGDATHGKFVMVLDAAADAGMSEILFSVEESAEAADGG